MPYNPAVTRAMYHHIVSSFDDIHTFLSDAQGLISSERTFAIPIACYDALTLASQHIVDVTPYVIEYQEREPLKSAHLPAILSELRTWADAIDRAIRNEIPLL